MRGGTTLAWTAAQSYHLIQATLDDGRCQVTVPGTTISVVGTNSQAVIEEVRRQLYGFLKDGQVNPDAPKG